MQTVQIVLGKDLLRATDRAARRRHVNRSALVGEVLQEYLRRLATGERERCDRDGYQSRPLGLGEFSVWDKVAAWPDA